MPEPVEGHGQEREPDEAERVQALLLWTVDPAYFDALQRGETGAEALRHATTAVVRALASEHEAALSVAEDRIRGLQAEHAELRRTLGGLVGGILGHRPKSTTAGAVYSVQISASTIHKAQELLAALSDRPSQEER